MKKIIVQHERVEWSNSYVDRLSNAFPSLEFTAAHSQEDAFKLAPESNAFIGIGPFMPPALVAAMPKLEWIQTLTTGIDNFVHMKELPLHVPVTKMSGIHGPQVSEMALMMMMSLSRRLPDMLAAQNAAKWDRHVQPSLFGKTLCILGLGSIAEILARYATTLGMTVTGVSNGRTFAPDITRIYPRIELPQAVAEADFLVVLVPLTNETRHIVNAKILASMKPTAFLLNLARGGCVDEAALIHALNNGEIAGAGLDVFENEPLPSDAPIWNAPNVILTPHVGGMADIFPEQCMPTLMENLTIYSQSGAQAIQTSLVR